MLSRPSSSVTNAQFIVQPLLSQHDQSSYQDSSQHVSSRSTTSKPSTSYSNRGSTADRKRGVFETNFSTSFKSQQPPLQLSQSSQSTQIGSQDSFGNGSGSIQFVLSGERCPGLRQSPTLMPTMIRSNLVESPALQSPSTTIINTQQIQSDSAITTSVEINNAVVEQPKNVHPQIQLYRQQQIRPLTSNIRYLTNDQLQQQQQEPQLTKHFTPNHNNNNAHPTQQYSQNMFNRIILKQTEKKRIKLQSIGPIIPASPPPLLNSLNTSHIEQALAAVTLAAALAAAAQTQPTTSSSTTAVTIPKQVDLIKNRLNSANNTHLTRPSNCYSARRYSTSSSFTGSIEFNNNDTSGFKSARATQRHSNKEKESKQQQKLENSAILRSFYDPEFIDSANNKPIYPTTSTIGVASGPFEELLPSTMVNSSLASTSVSSKSSPLSSQCIIATGSNSHRNSTDKSLRISTPRTISDVQSSMNSGMFRITSMAGGNNNNNNHNHSSFMQYPNTSSNNTSLNCIGGQPRSIRTANSSDCTSARDLLVTTTTTPPLVEQAKNTIAAMIRKKQSAQVYIREYHLKVKRELNEQKAKKQAEAAVNLQSGMECKQENEKKRKGRNQSAKAISKKPCDLVVEAVGISACLYPSTPSEITRTLRSNQHPLMRIVKVKEDPMQKLKRELLKSDTIEQGFTRYELRQVDANQPVSPKNYYPDDDTESTDNPVRLIGANRETYSMRKRRANDAYNTSPGNLDESEYHSNQREGVASADSTSPVHASRNSFSKSIKKNLSGEKQFSEGKNVPVVSFVGSPKSSMHGESNRKQSQRASSRLPQNSKDELIIMSPTSNSGLSQQQPNSPVPFHQLQHFEYSDVAASSGKNEQHSANVELIKSSGMSSNQKRSNRRSRHDNDQGNNVTQAEIGVRPWTQNHNQEDDEYIQ